MNDIANIIVIVCFIYALLFKSIFPEADNFFVKIIRKGIFKVFKAFYTVYDKMYFFYLTKKIKNIDTATTKNKIKHFKKYRGNGIVTCIHENCQYFKKCPYKDKTKLIESDRLYFVYKIDGCKL
ncbi:MAG: hypothetical protein LBG48_03250, partial [Rickettsiales bacterium]|nr:hypothetical protein [Rickettsiales bacterium]